MTVLIVEDSPSCSKLFHDLLDAYGIESRQTRTAFEAIQCIKELRPELVLMDVRLPDTSGLALARWLKTDDDLASISIVAVTASATPEGEKLALAVGCDDYVAKPISLVPFIKTIKKYVSPRYDA